MTKYQKIANALATAPNALWCDEILALWMPFIDIVDNGTDEDLTALMTALQAEKQTSRVESATEDVEWAIARRRVATQQAATAFVFNLQAHGEGNGVKRELTVTTRIKRAIKKFLRKRGVDEQTNAAVAEYIVDYANAERGVINIGGIDFKDDEHCKQRSLCAYQSVMSFINSVEKETALNIIEALLITSNVVNA